MSTDTRPSVTVIGNLWETRSGWEISVDDLHDIGLQDGDEVEVTIRKHERTTGNLLEPREETHG